MVENTLIWHYTKDGEFSIKSAYHVGLNFIEHSTHNSGSLGPSYGVATTYGKRL